mgnify:CR=1 FL=1
MTSAERALRFVTMLLVAAALAAAGPAGAQNDTRVSREREALRRSQQALQKSQEAQSSLQREKAALAAEKDKLDGEAKRSGQALEGAQAQSRTLRAELSRAQAALAQAQAELARLRDDGKQAAAAQQARAVALEQSLGEARRLLAERATTVASVTELLSRSTAALAEAERKNRALYALGRKLIDEYRSETGSAREPFLQLQQVQSENRAEELRTQIEAQRLLVPAPPTSGTRQP